MTDYKVLFLDIDGTILKPDGKIDNSTIYAINQVQNKGIEVFLATGRPLHEISFLSEQLNVHSFIGYNGAYATYQEETIVNEPMKKNTVIHFLETAKSYGHDLLFYSADKNIFTSLDSPVIQEMIHHLKFQHNKVYDSGDENGVLSASLINIYEEELEKYQTDEDIHFSPVLAENQNGRNFYDVIRDNVTKGSAITKLLNRISISPDQAIAFGDGLNDKEMLEAVGAGFAMGNAHPLLFDYAKHSTTSVAENGVYHGLQSLGLVE